MKSFLFAVFALFTVTSAHAQGISYFQEVAFSSATTYTVAIPSAPLIGSQNIDVTSLVPTGKLNGAFAVEVYNLAGSTSTINCSYDSRLVSTPSSSKFYGRELAAGIAMVWQVLQGKLTLYCQTQNTSGITYATVTQIR